MDTKLILVDGMPGVGKSTVSQFIDLQLRESGFASSWNHEETIHPVRQFYDTARHGSWSDYTEEVVSLWLRYTRELEGLHRIEILDAALLQTHVRSMLIFNAPRGAIMEMAQKVANVISRLNPTFIYLKPKSIEENICNVIRNRGDRMLELWLDAHDRYPYTMYSGTNGYSAFIDFWKEFDQIADNIFDTLNMSKLLQWTSNGSWEKRFLEICAFLNLSLSTNSSTSLDFAHFAGDYVPVDDDKSPGFRLLLADGCLVALAKHPTFDPSRTPVVRFEKSLLLPQGGNTCLLVGWPYVIQFTEDRFKSVQATVRAEYSETGEVYVKS